MRRVVMQAVAVGLAVAVVEADPGKPLAVRHWGRGVVSIETYWNLRVAVGPDRAAVRGAEAMPEPDLVVLAAEYPVHGAPINLGFLHAKPLRFDVVLDCPPNAAQPTVGPANSPPSARSDHPVRIHSIAAAPGQGSSGPPPAETVLVEADGVRVLYAGDLMPAAVPEPIDVLVVRHSGDSTVRRLVARLEPRLLVLLDVDPADSDLAGGRQIVRSPGNTIAVFAAEKAGEAVAHVVRLGTQPWAMPPELADLFARKERAARTTAAVFAPLSVAQMNHRPANGTHTPRWNAEHMMGRELGFFTRIYSGLQPGFGHLDLNPAQMPPDYEPAHPDWSGAEEARQIERVQALVRRFSYLLEGEDLDAKPAGSWWTLRRLFLQMERHYGEHTGHVRAKFEQPDWPAE